MGVIKTSGLYGFFFCGDLDGINSLTSASSAQVVRWAQIGGPAKANPFVVTIFLWNTFKNKFFTYSKEKAFSN